MTPILHRRRDRLHRLRSLCRWQEQQIGRNAAAAERWRSTAIIRTRQLGRMQGNWFGFGLVVGLVMGGAFAYLVGGK